MQKNIIRTTLSLLALVIIIFGHYYASKFLEKAQIDSIPDLPLIGNLSNSENAEKFTQSFVWSPIKDETNDQRKNLHKVRFKNGTEIKNESSEEQHLVHNELIVKDSAGAETILLTDDYVDIDAAFPSPSEATVAIATTQCAGNTCDWRSTYVITIKGNTVEKYFVGNNVDYVKLLIEGNDISSGIAKASIGTNDVGDEVSKHLRFFPTVGFGYTNISTKYLDIVGKYPHDFFTNETLRKPLLEAMGEKTFKSLRSKLDVSTLITLESHKYLVFEGCEAHECNDSWGTLIIDATNDQFWWLTKSKTNLRHSGNLKLPSEETRSFNALLSQIFSRHKMLVFMGDDGDFQVESTANKKLIK